MSSTHLASFALSFAHLSFSLAPPNNFISLLFFAHYPILLILFPVPHSHSLAFCSERLTCHDKVSTKSGERIYVELREHFICNKHGANEREKRETELNYTTTCTHVQYHTIELDLVPILITCSATCLLYYSICFEFYYYA